MGFIREFFGHVIRQSMEDPDERDQKIRDHVASTKAQCEKVKEGWAHPVKPYGYWTTDKYNYKYLLDLKMSNVTGRHDPYDKMP